MEWSQMDKGLQESATFSPFRGDVNISVLRVAVASLVGLGTGLDWKLSGILHGTDFDIYDLEDKVVLARIQVRPEETRVYATTEGADRLFCCPDSGLILDLGADERFWARKEGSHTLFKFPDKIPSPASPTLLERLRNPFSR